MKINEISIRNPLKQALDSDDVSNILADHGWQLLGVGYEAAVAEHPGKSYVLKVFPAYSKYEDFLNFANSHKDSVHLPRFGSKHRRIPGTAWMYVRMEKLKPITQPDLISHYLPYVIDLILLEHQVGYRIITEQLTDAVGDRLHDLGFHLHDLKDPETLEQVYKRIGGHAPETWTHIVQQMSKYNQSHVGLLGWDLHADNLMLRGNTLVIVDPWVS